ncbi:DUF7224 domain-containing protein [Streptomyces poonensis]|uniref:DUF7224 domain-containing protein n=1 Tax=Streptomyces poonensis TaxID=68255 RepID=A0A918PP09_9ACTN|nr:hypothetical protein [Streptomyces poonensis]GGZ15499.1 hypothetical protein GCM10010365_39090 [Streptomyces poonensis]GLJ91512.1 hypothetical protein GCM10017589_41190 [Streptomyces poonensis]
MRIGTALRTTSVVWIAPLVLAWVWLVTSHEAANEPAYWAGNTALVGHTLPFYAPACAAFAAWEAGRMRRAGVHRLAPVRGRYAIAIGTLWPVVLLGVAGVAVCLLTVRMETGAAHDWPHLGVLAMAGYLITVHTVLGYGLGMLLPRILATPLILVVDYLCLVMPVTVVDPMWLRELTGWLAAPYGDVTITMHPVALAVPMVLATGFLAAVLVSAEIARWRRTRLVRVGAAAAASLICLSVFTVSAVYPVRDWDGDPPLRARTDPPVCAGDSPRICVPKEAAGSLDQLDASAREIVPRLVDAGLEPPEELAFVSEAADTDARTWRLFLHRDMSDVDVRASIAASALPMIPPCPTKSDARTGHAGTLAAWLMVKAGMSAEEIGSQYSQKLAADPRVMSVVNRETKLSPDKQLSWYTRNVTLLQQCKPAPETMPAASGTEG